jgi:hypothetical protein
LGLELVADDGEDDPLVADAPDVAARVAIRGMHAVRAYSADPERISSVFAELLGMERAGEASWPARGERRHGVIVYDAAPAEDGNHGRRHRAPRRIQHPRR